MSLDFSEPEQSCPMCGARQPFGADRCSECGEWISEKSAKSLKSLDADKLKRFRREIHGLAGFWIFFGALSVVLAVFLLTNDDLLGAMDPAGTMIVAGIALLLGAVWVVSGIASAYKQMWGVYAGLVVTYLNLAGNLIQLAGNQVRPNPCGLIISIFVIIQAHRVIKFSKELTRADIPLTQKPR